MDSISKDALMAWANLYCEIWKEPPWNEDFWKSVDVIADFQKEMRNPHAEAFLSFAEQKVVGFTHGYSVSKDELGVIAGSNLLDGLFEKSDRLYYVDELGVQKDYRGQGMAMSLSRELMRAAHVYHGIQKTVLRTDTEAIPARKVYCALGFKEVTVHDAKYPNRTYWIHSL